MQVVLEIAQAPQSGIEASADFMRTNLSAVNELLNGPDTSELAIILPKADPDHDDWRRALARDLARAHAPKRINVVSAIDAEGADPLLVYLRAASGVTGQYLVTHE